MTPVETVRWTPMREKRCLTLRPEVAGNPFPLLVELVLHFSDNQPYLKLLAAAVGSTPVQKKIDAIIANSVGYS